MAREPIRKVLRAYLSWLGALLLVIVGGVALDKSHAMQLATRLLWVLLGSSVLFVLWLWFEYHTSTGWYFRCKLWTLSKKLGRFARDAKRRMDAAILPHGPGKGAERTAILGSYAPRFGGDFTRCSTKAQRDALDRLGDRIERLAEPPRDFARPANGQQRASAYQKRLLSKAQNGAVDGD